MKKIYLICLIKIIATIIFFVRLELFVIPFTIMTIPLSLIAAYHENLALLCSLTIIVAFILWFFIIILMPCSVKSKNIQKVFITVVTIAMLFDFVSSFMYSNMYLKITCITISIIILVICIKNIMDTFVKR